MTWIIPLVFAVLVIGGAKNFPVMGTLVFALFMSIPTNILVWMLGSFVGLPKYRGWWNEAPMYFTMVFIISTLMWWFLAYNKFKEE